MLDRLEVTSRVTVCGDDVSHSKPDPEPYLLAAAKVGADPRQCVALEDSPNGVAAAEAAGCVTVAVPSLVPHPARQHPPGGELAGRAEPGPAAGPGRPLMTGVPKSPSSSRPGRGARGIATIEIGTPERLWVARVSGPPTRGGNMGVWSDIGGAICVAVTALGLVWSYRIWRKDGVTAGCARSPGR